MSDRVTNAADLVPADKYSYRPADSVHTFGQLIGHVATTTTLDARPDVRRNGRTRLKRGQRIKRRLC